MMTVNASCTDNKCLWRNRASSVHTARGLQQLPELSLTKWVKRSRGAKSVFGHLDAERSCSDADGLPFNWAGRHWVFHGHLWRPFAVWRRSACTGYEAMKQNSGIQHQQVQRMKYAHGGKCLGRIYTKFMGESCATMAVAQWITHAIINAASETWTNSKLRSDVNVWPACNKFLPHFRRKRWYRTWSRRTRPLRFSPRLTTSNTNACALFTSHWNTCN